MIEDEYTIDFILDSINHTFIQEKGKVIYSNPRTGLKPYKSDAIIILNFIYSYLEDARIRSNNMPHDVSVYSKNKNKKIFFIEDFKEYLRNP